LVFSKHFELALEFNLPLYLHSRLAGNDFVDIIKANRAKFPAGGVVNCFRGSIEELKQLIALDLYIGVTGLSLRSEENLEMIQ
jgi:TatD DNase family protein